MWKNVYVKACCECEFGMTLRYKRYSFGSGNKGGAETITWASKVCPMHQKQLKEDFFNHLEENMF